VIMAPTKPAHNVTRRPRFAFFLCAAFSLLSATAEETTKPEVFFQAHRGALDEMPENTLAAYAFAWGIPGAIPEVDIQMTSDGALVCIHDETPKRTTNAPPPWDKTPIAETPLDTLRSWDAGSHFDPKYASEKVPLLDEVFALMEGHPERRVYLDLKDVDTAKLLGKIHAHGLEQRVIFVHGDVEKCKELQNLYPGARTMTWLSGATQQQKNRFEELAATNFAGISQLQFHLRQSKVKPEIEYALDDAYLKEALRRCKEAGVDFQLRPFVFTPESLGKLLDLGVRHFVADAPKAFRDALDKAEK